MCDGDNDASTKPDACEVARADELVGGGAADAENLGSLFDGEGERLVRSHELVGL